MSSQPSWIVRINLRGLREKTCCCFHHTFVIGFLRALLTKFEICVLHFYQHKIPSEMEVAPHYKLLILFTLVTLLTRLTLLTSLTLLTLHCQIATFIPRWSCSILFLFQLQLQIYKRCITKTKVFHLELFHFINDKGFAKLNHVTTQPPATTPLLLSLFEFSLIANIAHISH